MTEKRCSIEGCERPFRARGFCHTHYVAARRSGDLETLDQPRHSITSVTDPDAGVGVCSVCGEGAGVRRRSGGGFACLAPRREWAARNRQRPEVIEYHRNYAKANGVVLKNRLRKYGLTEDEWSRLLDECGASCSICRTPLLTLAERHVDHDHSCCPGKGSCGECVRAILCRGCNVGIAGFRDTPELLRRAAEYLERYAS